MITYQTERYLAVRAEAEPLIRAHWEEVARNKDTIPLEIDHVAYARMDEREQLLVVTARDAGVLVGYLTFFVLPQGHPHYLGTPWAESDVFYVAPEHRKSGIGIGLFSLAESELYGRGVVVMHTHCKIEHPAAGKLLEALGHVPAETIYAKLVRSMP